MHWPFFRTRTVKCPDGTTRTVYRSINEACPLYINGWTADVAAGLKIPGNVSGDTKARYENRIEGLLFTLNEQNQSLMMHFRFVYLLYASNPCGSDAYFQRKIDILIDQQHEISTLKLKVAALIQIVTANPNDFVSISHALNEIESRIDGAPAASAASFEISESRAIAKDLIKGPEK